MKEKMLKSRGNKTENIAPNSVLIYGRHAVASALQNQKRIVNKVWCITECAAEVKNMLAAGKRRPDLINVVERKVLDAMLPNDAVHQGMAITAQRLKGCQIEDVCDAAEDKDNACVLVLDQVTDPQNVGAIIRSCAAFGALALVVQDKNSPEESGAMVKASAGTIEFLPICRVTNLNRAIEKLKDAGFWVVGMDGYAEDEISSISKGGKIAIVMGSEGKGMRRLVKESCDQTVKLKMNPKVESLNVSTAAAIALYEATKA